MPFGGPLWCGKEKAQDCFPGNPMDTKIHCTREALTDKQQEKNLNDMQKM